MSIIFFDTPLTNIDGATNWNIGNVTNMSGMFYDTTSLVDTSALNDWDISKSIDDSTQAIINMFYNSPTHPNFTNHPGKWYDGTFYYIPNCVVITVNLGEHVSSIGIYSKKDGTQTIVNNNNNSDGTQTSTITLYRGIPYTISSSYDSGYQIDSWASTPGDELDSLTLPATTYVITEATTLSITSKPFP